MPASTEQWTIGSLLDTATPYLREKGSESARLDAELLLAGSLGIERIQLYTDFDRPLSSREVEGYRALVARRAGHEPVAYILGQAHFRHLVLEVGPAVLIPRPETEELVEVALRLLRRRPASLSGGGEGHAPVVADVGTGSGAIALSLAQEVGLRVLATDVSEEALALAASNVGALGLEDSVELLQTDLLEGVPDGSLHLVISNPPYVSSAEIGELAPDVRSFEPMVALEAGEDGLEIFRRLLPEAARALRPGGSALLEVGDTQASRVEEIVRAAGFAMVSVYKDMSGKDRMIEATMPGAVRLPLDDLVDSEIRSLRGLLREGGIIGLPTDTVYGLGAGWDSAQGVRALFVAKGRAEEQTVAAVFSSVEQIEKRLPDLSPQSAKVLRAFLPGPYTFIVSTEVLRAPLVGTRDSLGVRVPDHPALLEMLASLDVPLAATSANRTGEPDVTSAEEAEPAVLAHCSVALTDPADAGDAHDRGGAGGLASSVVDLRPLAEGGAPIVLREGAVPAQEVLKRISELGL